MRKIVLAAAVAGVFALSACKGEAPAATETTAAAEATTEAAAPAADASAPAADASSEAPKM